MSVVNGRNLDARIRALETRLKQVEGIQQIQVEKLVAQVEETHRGVTLILSMLARDPELAKLIPQSPSDGPSSEG
ncbi:hypothetical protein GCM10022243_55400 [Saccharothrix violaceirubra]|uniref:Uncharacterized protein n=1 Tax=Saccharothrix violaceirubra TaxID=413306 RepID=A0A7W7WXF3_9PSEU|nr:hypothetical protein [Saccharothrix violaceirubra]MBB4967051.1 hypothetical protein [Saccharothrix violaceirubra]